jgi:hypothetical protein
MYGRCIPTVIAARGFRTSLFVMALGLSLVAAVEAVERPPRNPFLADSVNPLGHGDSGQQAALPVRGPKDPGRSLASDDIQYTHVGPAHFGAYASSPYPDGRRGGQRHNPLFSGPELDEDGRDHYGTPWGRVRLAPRKNSE